MLNRKKHNNEKHTAILVGFQYWEQSKNRIIGVIIDLYRAQRFCVKMGWNVYLFSDIKKANLPHKISKDIIDGDLDGDVMSFMSDVKDYILVNSKDDFIKKIREIPLLNKNIFVYYTGHGIGKSIVMPNNLTMLSIDFRDLILDRCSHDIEVFWILDCCNPASLNLPFKIRPDASLQYIKDSEVFHQKIILINSATEDQKSGATRFGSLFTKFFFQIIDYFASDDPSVWPSRNLKYIRNTVNLEIYNKKKKLSSGDHPQNVSIYISYPESKIIPMWISKSKYLFKFNTLENIIIMEKNNLL